MPFTCDVCLNITGEDNRADLMLSVTKTIAVPYWMEKMPACPKRLGPML